MPLFFLLFHRDPESFKDAIISYLFTRNSRTTKADRRYRSKFYSYCDPCSQWEQWSVVMPVKFSKDKNRVGQFHRCSKARCFQTFSDINYSHFVSSWRDCCSRIGWPSMFQQSEAVEHRRIYMIAIFTQPFICMERVALVVE